MNARAQQGSALIVAIFLVTVVAALGVFAVRLGVNQQQTASLQLVGYRVESAARAGIEAWAHRLASRNPALATPNCPSTPRNIAIGNSAGNEAFTVTLMSCTRIVSGIVPNEHAAYEITVEARRGNFGEPNFVRRTVSHRMSTIPPGTY